VDDSALELREAEIDLQQARDRLRYAPRAAHDEGASYALLTRPVGLKRERVSQIVRSDN
jgi:hypothetical protein